MGCVLTCRSMGRNPAGVSNLNVDLQSEMEATYYEDDSERPALSLSVLPSFLRDRHATVVGVVTARPSRDRVSVDVGPERRQDHHFLADESSTALELPVPFVFPLADLPGCSQ